MRNGRETEESRCWNMKKLKLLSLVGITSIALANAGWAAGHGGGGGGFGSGGGDGHAGGGGGGARAGGGHFGGGPGFSGRPAYYYGRGMRFTNSRAGQFRSAGSRSPSFARPNRGTTNSATRQSITSGRSALNSRMGGHIAERHEANWHGDWDRRHAHFDHNRFFVFIDGFWCGLDDGFFPWDYLPYYADDYYPYDYYADPQPNDNTGVQPDDNTGVQPDDNTAPVDNGVPVPDTTVQAVQTRLTQLGYYNGPVNGIFDPLTRDALANYQIDTHLTVTGSLSPDTLQSFGLPQA